MSASFIVRAQVVDASVKEAFDRWYQDEHLPDAVKAFGARRAWRGWSEVNPSVHYAVYEFDDIAKLRAIPGSAAMKELVAEFDRAWGEKVLRGRDSVRVVQRIET
ncbi:MAG TPA: hypothetical protein VFP62_12615 [Burkholderiales bacterium]|jgi:hypothetical protein|nr:hypothetical protein [Burkholderiales bacterium]